MNVAVVVAMAEGLLCNSDSGAGYGSLATTKHVGIAHNRLPQNESLMGDILLNKSIRTNRGFHKKKCQLYHKKLDNDVITVDVV